MGASGEEKDEGCSERFRTARVTSHLGLPRTQDVQDKPCQTRAVGHPGTMHPRCVEDLGRRLCESRKITSLKLGSQVSSTDWQRQCHLGAC